MAINTDRPNILLIMSDQHRFDCLGAYGNTEINTPNIDSLAEDGVIMTIAFVRLRYVHHQDIHW